MSHFTVLVVTDDKPSDDVLDKALAPFHEFECTGIDNEYVKDVDVTAKMRSDYAKDTTRRLRSPDGALHNPYAGHFYREPTPDEAKTMGPMAGIGSGNGVSWTSRDWEDGRGYRAKVRTSPDGWESIYVPTKDIMTFAQFAADWDGKHPVLHGQKPDLEKKHKYGYTLLAADGSVEKVIDRTNADARWDWWKLGGRWQGMLFAKRTAFSKMEIGRGAAGLMGSTHTNSKEGGVDWCRAGDLDIERMKNAAVAERRERWTTVQIKARANGLTLSEAELDTARRACAKERDALWKAWRDKTDKNGKHWTDGLTAHQKTMGTVFYDFGEITTDADIPIEQWIDAAPPISTFAVLKDGKWFELGKMGWWACVSDEKAEQEWSGEFEKLLRSLRPDQFVAVVDCHI